MGLNAYLYAADENNKYEGSCDINPHEGSIEIWGWDHKVDSPRDAASGLPTGKRRHHPFTVIKPVDKATPVMMQGLVDNVNVTEWKLRIYRPSKTGAEEEYYNIELFDANICSIHQEMLNNKYPENMQHPFRERVAFTYGKVIWTWMIDGNKTAEDSWRVQRG